MRFFPSWCYPKIAIDSLPSSPSLQTPGLPASALHPVVVQSREQPWERSCKENPPARSSAKVPGGRGWDEGDRSPLPPGPSHKARWPRYPSLPTGVVWLTRSGGRGGLGKVAERWYFCMMKYVNYQIPFLSFSTFIFF